LIRLLRRAALFSLLGVCLAGCALPCVAQAPGAAAKEENSEPPHALLYKTINFVILVGALGYLLRKPLSDYFRSRSAKIKQGLEEGRKALEASQARLREIEARLARLESEIAAFKDAALREMDAERQRMHQASAEEAARILESARAQTETAIRSARLELKRYAAGQAVGLAEQMIGSRLDDAGQRRLVTRFSATMEPKERKN
jgi:F-type H+-transporting ATPase subunit b